MQAVINETPLPIDLYRYVDVSGRVEQFGKFSVIFYDLNQVGSHTSYVISSQNVDVLKLHQSAVSAFKK